MIVRPLTSEMYDRTQPLKLKVFEKQIGYKKPVPVIFETHQKLTLNPHQPGVQM